MSMQLRTHVTTEADPRLRGLEYGAAYAAEIARAVTLYEEYWLAAGVPAETVQTVADGAAEALADWDPAALTEIGAVADGAGVEQHRLLALNARTEVVAHEPRPGAGECSTVASVGGDRAPRSAQTWDWIPMLAPVGLLRQLPAPTGTLKVFTEPGMLAKIGLNGAGLGLHFNILHHVSDAGDPGVPVHAVAHRILAEATSVGEAVDLARSARLSASTVLTVVCGSEAACLELSPAGVAVVTPEDGWLWHTNHFRDPALAEGGWYRPGGTTWARGDHVAALRDTWTATDPEAQGAGLCGSAGSAAPIEIRPDPTAPPHDQAATLLTIALDYPTGDLVAAPTAPSDSPGRFLRF